MICFIGLYGGIDVPATDIEVRCSTKNGFVLLSMFVEG